MRAAIAISFSDCTPSGIAKRVSARPSQTLSLRAWRCVFVWVCAVWKPQEISRADGTRGFSLLRAELSLAGTANPSAHKTTEDVFGAGAERNYRLDIGRRARAQGACDLDCGAGLTALAERDGVCATLVGARLASRAFSAIERCRSGGFARLSPQLCVGDASFCDEFDERETQLVREQLVMRE